MTTAQQLRGFDLLARAAALLRASEGNPNHKPSGPGGGQFTSGGGGHGPGKHHARRQRRKRRLERLKEGFRAEAKGIKARHEAEHRELTRDHGKAMAARRKEHARDRRDHLRWEAKERKGLARDHAREHAANDRQHAKALAKHEKDAPKRHAAVDTAHGEKARRIARGEKAAARIDRRHAAEREAHASSLEGLDAANERMYEAERKAHRDRGAAPEEHAALEKRIADHRVKVKEQPERQRADMAARHAREKEKAGAFLEKSAGLKERLAKQAAAKHRAIDRTPKKLAAQHAGAKERLEAEHADAREAMANDHREARRDVRKDQRDERASLRGDHAEERAGLKDTHREERREFLEGVRQELADRGFGGKSLSFGSKDEANAWADSHFRYIKDRLPDPQYRAIADYQAGAAVDLNNALRSRGDLTPQQDAMRKELDAAIGRDALPRDVTVTRFFTLQHMGLEDLKPGTTFTDHGFVSTSMNRKHWWIGQRMEIRLPRGTNVAVPGGSMSEMILGRGHQFRVRGIEEAAGGTPHTIVLDLVK